MKKAYIKEYDPVGIITNEFETLPSQKNNITRSRFYVFLDEKILFAFKVYDDYSYSIFNRSSKEVNNHNDESYESILNKKIEYYGKTEAAYAFAAENYATIKMIEENVKLLRIAEKYGNGKMEYEIHSRIEELERMIKT